MVLPLNPSLVVYPRTSYTDLDDLICNTWGACEFPSMLA
jgi:hypothetical protein